MEGSKAFQQISTFLLQIGIFNKGACKKHQRSPLNNKEIMKSSIIIENIKYTISNNAVIQLRLVS